jgi:hypothetical protein
LGIVAKYGCEYAGLIQYYLLAQDVFRLGRLRWCTMGLEVHHIRNLADLDQPGRRPAAEFTRRAAWRNGAGETDHRVPGRLAVHGVPVMARPTRQFWAVP